VLITGSICRAEGGEEGGLGEKGEGWWPGGSVGVRGQVGGKQADWGKTLTLEGGESGRGRVIPSSKGCC